MQTALDYRTNRDLFSNHYLDEQLPETEAWNAADEAEVREAYEKLDRLYREQSDLVTEYDERQLRENLLDPVFDLLGLTTAVEVPVGGERLVPDYALFGSERAREDAFERRIEGSDFYANALAVADAKRWGRSLDGRGEREFTDPSYQFHAYLDATGLDRGILTNGERWRLYYGPTSHRLDSYYEIDLPTLLETGDPEAFKYFYLFFRREAFLGGGGTRDATGRRASDANARTVPADHLGADRPFVERVHRQSNVFAEELSEDLRENVYDALRLLAEGFVTSDDDLGSDDLDRVYEASLTCLYRLIFVLYAESEGRDLLETDNDLYRRRYSLDTLKRRVAEELDSPEPIYREWQTALWDRLKELFTLVDGGSAAQGIPEEDLYVPAYNGGLFKTDPASGETAAFLDSHAVGDWHLSRVLELLTRRESESGDDGSDVDDGDDGDNDGDSNDNGDSGDSNGGDDSDDGSAPGDGRVFVDYSSLDVRHLGSIYEGLLEYDLEIADEPLAAVRDDGEQEWVPAANVSKESDPEVVERVEPGDVYLTTETGKRKTTGSYYTPEFVVEYVVEHTLDPLLDEIRADLDPDDPDYAERFAERVFDLSILDPAMGSGHFLVKTVEYLARAVVRARQEQTGRVPQEQVGGTDEQVGRADAGTVPEAGASATADPRNVHWARRQVARQCIYGVDENGMAVELAKVSLWLRTLAAGQPLAFLDHHLVQGDSLAGAATENFGTEVPEKESNPETGARFDAVVGNPPYVRSRNLPEDLKEYYRREFRTAKGAYDLYVPFVELAADLGRRVSLVVPNKWTTTDYGRELRDLLLDDHRLREVLDASNLDVFPDADVYPVVITSEREGGSDGATADDEASGGNSHEPSDEPHQIRVRQPADEDSLSTAPTTAVSRSFVDRLGGRVVPLDLDPEFAEIAARVLADCDRLGDHVTMSEGVHTGNVREKLLTDDPDVEEHQYRKVVGGDSVGRYRLDWDGTWLHHDESLVERENGEYADLRDPGLFEGEKLLVRDISDRPVAVYDDGDHYALNTLYSVRPREKSGLAPRYLLGVFNSAFVTAYVRQVYGGTHVSGDYLRFKPMFAEEIPVPDPDSDLHSATVEPSAVARETGVEREVPADPEAAVATLTERRREASDERADLNRDVLDYLPEPSASDSPVGRSAGLSGPTLAEVGVPVKGVGDSVLAETASDREGLRIGEVLVDDDGGTPVLSVTARYKPDDEAGGRGASNGTDRESDLEADQWGYVETDPVAAMRFPDLDGIVPGHRETAVALVEAFVPAAAERGRGFAGFRETATKTNSLLDRLRALTLPDPEEVAAEVQRYREVQARAEELDERIEALEDAIDGIVYRLYGLDDDEIALVERLAED